MKPIVAVDGEAAVFSDVVAGFNRGGLPRAGCVGGIHQVGVVLAVVHDVDLVVTVDHDAVVVAVVALVGDGGGAVDHARTPCRPVERDRRDGRVSWSFHPVNAGLQFPIDVHGKCSVCRRPSGVGPHGELGQVQMLHRHPKDGSVVCAQ